MGYNEEQISSLMRQYVEWKELNKGTNEQFLDLAFAKSPNEVSAAKKARGPLTEEDKEVNANIRDVFNKKLSWRLRGKGAAEGEIRKMREMLIEQLMDVPAKRRLGTAEYHINEIIRMHNL